MLYSTCATQHREQAFARHIASPGEGLHANMRDHEARVQTFSFEQMIGELTLILSTDISQSILSSQHLIS